MFCAMGIRITPAHAGTSPLNVAKVLMGQDHPRTRGDKQQNAVSAEIDQGSPPHTRGQVPARCRARKDGRITPAHAGTRRSLEHFQEREMDHPRTRGDKATPATLRTRTRGSPPHTRGQVCLASETFQGMRITPAHAGTSTNGRFLWGTRTDHPRTRGDKSLR